MCVPLGLLRVHQGDDTIPKFSSATVTTRPHTPPTARPPPPGLQRPGPGSPRAPELFQAFRIPGCLVPEPRESAESTRAAAVAGAQGVAAHPGEALHRGATSDRRSLGPGSPDPRSLEGCAPRGPLRRRPTVFPCTPAPHSPRRTAGTRRDAGRARFLRVDNRLPAAARTPGARLLHAHARARASTRHPQPGAVLATVVGHGHGRGRWHLRRRLRAEVQVCLRRPAPWHVPSSSSCLKCLAKGRDFIPGLTGKEEAWAGFRSARNERLRTLLVP